MSTHKRNAPTVLVRWLSWQDLPAVAVIEAAVFPEPWGATGILARVRRTNCIGLVAEEGGQVIGFTVYKLRGSTLHVLRTAVDPDHCSGEILPKILAYLTAASTRHGCRQITLLVRETDLDTQQLFRAAGFRAIRLLRGYFQETGEDAYRMRLEVGWGTAMEGRAA